MFYFGNNAGGSSWRGGDDRSLPELSPCRSEFFLFLVITLKRGKTRWKTRFRFMGIFSENADGVPSIHVRQFFASNGNSTKVFANTPALVFHNFPKNNVTVKLILVNVRLRVRSNIAKIIATWPFSHWYVTRRRVWSIYQFLFCFYSSLKHFCYEIFSAMKRLVAKLARDKARKNLTSITFYNTAKNNFNRLQISHF